MVTRVAFFEGEVYYPADGDYVPYEEYEELLAERDALKADAERYRWLREDRPESPLNVVNELGFWIHEETLDAAIDAARSTVY